MSSQEELEQKLDKHFYFERVTKINVSNETQHTYIATPLELKGADARQAVIDFILSREEKQKQRMKEKLEELREFQPSGSGDCTSCGSYMGSGEHYCKEMMKNEALDDILALLEE